MGDHDAGWLFHLPKIKTQPTKVLREISNYVTTLATNMGNPHQTRKRSPPKLPKEEELPILRTGSFKIN
jgi:hypothetical protein